MIIKRTAIRFSFQSRRQLVGEAVCQGHYLANTFAPTVAARFRYVVFEVLSMKSEGKQRQYHARTT
ncbi:hypothetical protein AUC60_23335 [Pseudomonas caspiana]|uniref:Uncharacterized protein n=1 Tax=Pseudomonas caspiana TaxID=1451454 RepID=A0A1Y3NY07_9PSED|nr:hypothetical protein AUC60_23335 [Pseudomonas caspiana]